MAAKREGTKGKGKKATSARSGRKEGAASAIENEQKGEQEELLDMDEALDLLKTSRPTLYRWLREGRLRGMKIGRQWRFTREDLERFLNGEAPNTESDEAFAPLIETLTARLEEAGCDPETADSKPDAETPAPQIVFSLMVWLAMQLRASNIHLEFIQDRASLRYRVDGVLHEVAEVDAQLVKPIVNHWKMLGKANAQIDHLPQDCRIQLAIDGSDIDLRVSILPTVSGEIMTARLLDQNAAKIDLDRIPFRDEHREVVERALQANHGIIVCTGPVGSGKTTTMYAMLNRLNTAQRKLMSVEDPVEYMLDGVSQTQVRPQHGMTYAPILRAMLRGDPDVLMVGEISDSDTAQLCTQAALTGNIVLTQLHTSDAAGALTRLYDLGVEPFQISDAVRLVIAQRLLRRLCPECAAPATPDAEQLETAKQRINAGGGSWDDIPGQWKRAVGCPACRGLGYQGRTSIHEVVELSGDLRREVLQGSDHEALQRVAIANGMTTLPAEAITVAGRGETSLEEALRILPEA